MKGQKMSRLTDYIGEYGDQEFQRMVEEVRLYLESSAEEQATVYMHLVKPDIQMLCSFFETRLHNIKIEIRVSRSGYQVEEVVAWNLDKTQSLKFAKLVNRLVDDPVLPFITHRTESMYYTPEESISLEGPPEIL